MAFSQTQVSGSPIVIGSRVLEVCDLSEELVLCIAEIEDNCLFVKDIYQTNPPPSQLALLERYLEDDELGYRLVAAPAHAKAALVIRMLGMMEPLVPQDAQESFLNIATRLSEHSTANESLLGDIHGVLKQLPEGNRAMLLYLLRHLKHVANEAKYNKMDSKRLAAVFAPTVFKRGEAGFVPADQVMDYTPFNRLLTFMITDLDKILRQGSSEDLTGYNCPTPVGKKPEY